MKSSCACTTLIALLQGALPVATSTGSSVHPIDAVFVIGVMKSGTTALCERLARHPALLITRPLINEPDHYRHVPQLYSTRSQSEQAVSFEPNTTLL